MIEVKMCPECLSKYVVDKTGICPNCKGKGLPKVVEEKKAGKEK